MRTIIGMILGSVLTVAGAYVSDVTAPVTGAPPMVNWDIAGQRLHTLAVLANRKISNFLGSEQKAAAAPPAPPEPTLDSF